MPSTRLNLTDSDIPDDITVQLASEAQSATQAASATNALLLEGQPGSYYLDAANLTGTIPSSRLSLTDSDVPNGLTLSGGTINNSPIGSATPASGVFTDLISSGTTQFESGSIMLGKVGAANRGEVLLHDATDATDYLVSLLAPSNLVGDVTWTLPSTDGSSGQVLGTDGSGNLSFYTIEVPLGGTTIAIGDNAAVSNDGVAVGKQANGIYYGTAVGYTANADSYGVAVGYQANGYDANVAIGRRANGYTGAGPYSGSVSVGYTANAYSGDGAFCGGVAVGYQANARHNFNENAAGAVAIGRRANAFIKGVAIGGSTIRFLDGYDVGSPHYDGNLGYTTSGYNQGVAVGYAAGGQNYGVGIGYRANGYLYGTAIGYRANAGNNHYAFAKGAYSRPIRYNEEWKGADNISVNSNTLHLNGHNKFGYGQVDFHGTTTTSSPTEIYLGGTFGQRFTLQDNSAVCFTAYTVAVNTNTGDTSGWQHSGVIKRRSGANTTSIVGSVNALKTSEQGGLTTDPTFTADTTNGSLKVQVTGVNANIVYWNVMVIYSELRE